MSSGWFLGLGALFCRKASAAHRDSTDLRMKCIYVVGARPNLMKAAPVCEALSGFASVKQTLVHTGQHYDANTSGVFFQQLGLPKPDHSLNFGSGSHARQTAEIMVAFEQLLSQDRPDVVVV